MIFVPKKVSRKERRIIREDYRLYIEQIRQLSARMGVSAETYVELRMGQFAQQRRRRKRTRLPKSIRKAAQ